MLISYSPLELSTVILGESSRIWISIVVAEIYSSYGLVIASIISHSKIIVKISFVAIYWSFPIPFTKLSYGVSYYHVLLSKPFSPSNHTVCGVITSFWAAIWILGLNFFFLLVPISTLPVTFTLEGKNPCVFIHAETTGLQCFQLSLPTFFQLGSINNEFPCYVQWLLKTVRVY